MVVIHVRLIQRTLTSLERDSSLFDGRTNHRQESGQVIKSVGPITPFTSNIASGRACGGVDTAVLISTSGRIHAVGRM